MSSVRLPSPTIFWKSQCRSILPYKVTMNRTFQNCAWALAKPHNMCCNARAQGDTWIVQGHEFAHVFRCTEPLQLCQSYGATERQRVEGLNVKRDLVHCQKRPSTEVKENYDTGTRAHLSDRAWRASTEASTTPPMSLEKFARVSRRSWIHVVTPWVHQVRQENL